MSSEEPKVKVTIERENVEPVEFEVNGLVSESVRVMVSLGIDETEARGQVMLAAVSPFDASKLLLDVDLDDCDRTARIAKELAASDFS